MSDDLVVIRTYSNEIAADAALASLQAAGIQSLLLAESLSAPPAPEVATMDASHGYGLAVHRRDVKIAEAVLLASPSSTC